MLGLIEMQLLRRTYSWARLAVIIWVSVWMLAVPWFHVHPQTDHQHGEIGHTHGGTIHTVWAPDFDPEHDGHRHVDDTNEWVSGDFSSIAGLSQGVDSLSEFSFLFLSGSTDRKSLKPAFVQAFILSPPVILDVGWHVRIYGDTPTGSQSIAFVHAISPRAPPSLLL
jgi:hypothetical protein